MNESRGFTMLEMIVTMSIIAFFVSIALVLIGFAKTEAQDAVRISDLGIIARALASHNTEFGHWIENGYGPNNGNGYLNVADEKSGNPSVMGRLVSSGHLEWAITDPSGAEGSSLEHNYNGYMKYHCPLAPAKPTAVYLYARLEGKPLSDTATDGTCCPECDTKYNMNYYKLISTGN